MYFLLDANSTIDGTLNTASKLGGNVFLASLIIISCMVLASFYIWKVAIPRQRTDAELAKKLGEATAAMGKVVAETHKIVKNNSEDLDYIIRMIINHTSCNEDIVEIISKIADAYGIDIDKELGIIKGKLTSYVSNAKNQVHRYD